MPSAVRRAQPALLLVALLIAQLSPAPAPTRAALVLDYEIPGGRFYTQGNGYPAGTSPKGFSLVDNAAARLHSEYNRLGGFTTLGPPISRRFELGGQPAQVLRKGVMVWRGGDEGATFLNVMDMLAEQGRDDWLLKNHGIPKRADLGADAGKSYEQIAAARTEWLRQFPAFHAFYFNLDQPQAVLGLPTSRVEDTGQALVMRFQRGAIRQAKVDAFGLAAGELALVDTGEIARQAGLVKASFFPENPPANAPDWTGVTMVGKATFYGAEFHGKAMANGQPFNMHDPTITACNAYPLGTRLKVTNRNGFSIEVKVTDTGGFSYPLVVDLSQAAFRLLAGPNDSLIDVTVEVLATP